MRRSRLPAAVSALALVLALATSARADCPSEVSLGSGGGTWTLVGSYEVREQFNAPVWVGTSIVTVRMTLSTQVGVYIGSNGDRIDVACSSSLSLG
ncbi:MAG TPA: hypothetical protein VIL18_01300 [Longimicrobiales bacterium]